ncbi:MAG: hypothetical protein LH485_07300 [Sphingomonas bacterium]|nr:hypothetical protein [Sphingomonas bacterium]
MSAHGFKSLFMAASVAGAALGCYLVSLNVASERAKLERVEGKIVLAQRDIRLLQTEIGTRGRLAQLERWNVGFIRLSAPTADQFLEGGFQLATMVKPVPKPTIEAPIVLASAPTEQGVTRQSSTSDGDEAKPVTVGRSAGPSAQDMMRVASYQRPQPRTLPTAIAPSKPAKSAAIKSVATKSELPKAALPKTALPKATVPKVVGPKRTTMASADALAPLPASAPRKSKETGTPQ